MKTIETGAVMTESQLSQQISIVDDATANEEESKEQIEEETVNRAASEHATGFPIPIMRDDEEIQAADNARPPAKRLKR